MERKSLLFFLLIALLAPLAMNGQTTLLSENFDGTGFAIYNNTYDSRAWYTYNAGSGNNWAHEQNATYAHSGEFSMMYSYAYSDANCYLVSEPFNVSSTMTQLSVSLYEVVRSSTWTERFEVFFVKASDVTTLAGVASATHYSAIASAEYKNTTYAQVSGSVSSSALKGQSVRVVVRCTSESDQWALYIDDITVTETTGAVTTYTVTYNANGGTGTMTDTNSPYISGSTVTVMSNTFTAPSDMTFSGWNTAANGSGTSYAPGDHFSISANTTLYAQWAAACDYFEDFENVSGASSGYSSAGSLPTGWDQIYTGTVNSTTAQAPHVHNGSSYPGPGSGTNALSGYYLGFYGTGNNSNSYAIMPAFASNEAANHISFKYRYESTSNGTLSYGVIDGTDASTYVVLGTCSTSSNPGFVDVDLNTSQTAGKRLAFRWAYSASSWYTAAIDDICVMTESTSNCPTPTNVTVSNITPNSASVSWDGEASSYNVRYRTAAGDGETVLYEDFENGIPSTWTKINSDGDAYNWIAVSEIGTTFTYYASVDLSTWVHGGSNAASSCSYYNKPGGGGTSLNTNQWLITPQVELKGTLRFYAASSYSDLDSYEVLLSTTGTATSNFTTTLKAMGTATYYSDNWDEIEIDLSAYAGQQGYIAIHHVSNGMYFLLIDDFGIYDEGTAGPWSDPVLTTDENSTPLDHLLGETTYEVQVQANCGEDGLSQWTDAVSFTTLSACAAPGELSAELTNNTAALSWSDYQDNYNVRYRKVFLHEDFESGIPSTWTKIDADGDGHNWLALSEVPSTYSAYSDVSFWAHGGSDGACSPSYYNTGTNSGTALNTNNWLITPLVDLQGTLTFYATSKYDDPDQYEVLLSTTGTATSDFTITLQAMGNATYNSWDEVEIDLSAYEGQQGYIAIHHVSSDKYFLVIDDFGIYSDWTTVPASEATATINNLSSETTYEWQVQGVNCDGNGNPTDWSASAYFTTGEFYVKHIVSYSDTSIQDWDGWYLITSPLATATDPANVANMTSNIYDLYRFNQSPAINEGVGLEWINYKDQNFNVNQEFGSLYAGTGYLYANSQDVDLVFTGTAYNGTGVFSLTYNTTNPDSNMHGWNLVGNPFTEPAAVDKRYYAMNTTGTDIMLGTGNVRAMDGIFVRATAANQTVTFTKPSKGNATTNGESVMINLSKDQKVIDRAAVSFDEGDQLPKFQLYQNSTKIYIPVDGVDYAVVSSEGIGELPFSFKAEQNGTYTLSLNSEGVSFGYLHLIDNMTGNDIDMLVNPSYSFEARTSDYASRFKLVFATGDNANDNFAFFSNGSFVINNDGAATLQVIDITGRILKSESINGCTNVNVNAAPGVYMIRLINGTDVKVQKVVVK